jgi:hypothetical protein
LERAGQDALLIESGNDLIQVNVQQLLSDIENEAQSKQAGDDVTNGYIGNDFKGNLTVRDGNMSTTNRAPENL